MNGELASLIALCLHGNAWLRRGDGAPAPRLDTENSAIKYVRGVRFEVPGGWPSRKPRIWIGTPDWLNEQRNADVGRLWLAVPEASASASGPLAGHMAAAFANGSQWAVLSTGRRATFLVAKLGCW